MLSMCWQRPLQIILSFFAQTVFNQFVLACVGISASQPLLLASALSLEPLLIAFRVLLIPSQSLMTVISDSSMGMFFRPSPRSEPPPPTAERTHILPMTFFACLRPEPSHTTYRSFFPLGFTVRRSSDAAKKVDAVTRAALKTLLLKRERRKRTSWAVTHSTKETQQAQIAPCGRAEFQKPALSSPPVL